MHYSSQPTDRCKSRSEPITENSSDAPRQRFIPLAPDDHARRMAPYGRSSLPLHSRLGSAPGNRGSTSHELPYIPLHHAGRDTADRTGGECAPAARPGAKTQLPFAALPHDLRKDPRLRGKDKAILLAAALLESHALSPRARPPTPG